MVDRANAYKLVVYTDPETDRAVVARTGIVPIPEPYRVQQPETWLLKIQELILNNQSPMACALSRELAAVREELAPQLHGRRPVKHTLTLREATRAALWSRRAPRSSLPTRKPLPQEPLPAPSPLHPAEQVEGLQTHTQAKALLSCG